MDTGGQTYINTAAHPFNSNSCDTNHHHHHHKYSNNNNDDDDLVRSSTFRKWTNRKVCMQRPVVIIIIIIVSIGAFILIFSNQLKSAAGLKALKPAANGRYFSVQIITLLFPFHCTEVCLSSCQLKCMLGLFVFSYSTEL